MPGGDEGNRPEPIRHPDELFAHALRPRGGRQPCGHVSAHPRPGRGHPPIHRGPRHRHDRDHDRGAEEPEARQAIHRRGHGPLCGQPSRTDAEGSDQWQQPDGTGRSFRAGVEGDRRRRQGDRPALRLCVSQHHAELLRMVRGLRRLCPDRTGKNLSRGHGDVLDRLRRGHQSAAAKQGGVVPEVWQGTGDGGERRRP